MTTKCSERIRFLQKETGITQKELADVLEVKPQVVSYWMAGHYPADSKYMEVLNRVIGFVSQMRIAPETKKVFVIGYISGRMRALRHG